MNVLIFSIKQDLGWKIDLVANNEHDLREYLEKEYGFHSINFSDLDASYGTCSFKCKKGYSEMAQCKYAKKI